MAQYNTLNIKLSNPQINKLKSGIKNGTGLTLHIALNVVGDSNDEKNFPHKLLLTNKQVSKLCKAFANNSLASTKLSKSQLHKIRQSRGFLGRLLGPFLKTGLALIENLLKLLGKSILVLGLTAAASATDTAIHKKMLALGTTTSIISNEEINDIMKIIKYLEESGLLKKGVSETIKK